MKLNYKLLGQYIRQIDVRNDSGSEVNLLGVSTQKKFIDSIANTIGTNFKKYKVIKKNQFAYVPDTSRRGDKIGIAMLLDRDEAIVSQAYTVFEIIDENLLNPEYLMMWFSRVEFDRYARYMSHGSVREIFSWEDMCNVKLPVPSIEKQREIVKDYNTILNRIQLNENVIDKIEYFSYSIYKKWFMDFEFPDKNGVSYKSNGGEMMESQLGLIPREWKVDSLGSLINISSGKRPQKTSLIKNEEFKYPLIGASSIMGYVPNYLYEEQILVIGRVGTHGVVQRFSNPVWPSDNTLVIKTKYNEFINQILNRIDYKGLNTGSTQPLITQTDIKNIQVVIPTRECLIMFEEKLSKLSKFSSKLYLEIDYLNSLKDILLAKLTIE